MSLPIDNLFIDDFDYGLSTSLVAEAPLAERHFSKLLVFKNETIHDAEFQNLPDHLPPNTLLVLNNTRVIEARIFLKKLPAALSKFSAFRLIEQGSMEGAMQQTRTTQWQCLIGGASKWKKGLLLQKEILIQDETILLTAQYIGKEDEHFIVEFSWNADVAFSKILEAAGQIPLPPYIKRVPELWDAERYQTVFAARKGSVAAPTAALHFTQAVFKKLEASEIKTASVTLHVGAGTFKPVKTATIAEHLMHKEGFSVTQNLLKALLEAPEIIAVGTTSLRTLESLYWISLKLMKGDETFKLHQWDPYEMETDNRTYKECIAYLLNYLQQNGKEELTCQTGLLIIPGYVFKSAVALITNFHQPRSTLLLLVAAFIGPNWKKVYEHAMANQYRFLSYGDSSLLWRKER